MARSKKIKKKRKSTKKNIQNLYLDLVKVVLILPHILNF